MDEAVSLRSGVDALENLTQNYARLQLANHSAAEELKKYAIVLAACHQQVAFVESNPIDSVLGIVLFLCSFHVTSLKNEAAKQTAALNALRKLCKELQLQNQSELDSSEAITRANNVSLFPPGYRDVPEQLPRQPCVSLSSLSMLARFPQAEQLSLSQDFQARIKAMAAEIEAQDSKVQEALQEGMDLRKSLEARVAEDDERVRLHDESTSEFEAKVKAIEEKHQEDSALADKEAAAAAELESTLAVLIKAELSLQEELVECSGRFESFQAVLESSSKHFAEYKEQKDMLDKYVPPWLRRSPAGLCHPPLHSTSSSSRNSSLAGN